MKSRTAGWLLILDIALISVATAVTPLVARAQAAQSSTGEIQAATMKLYDAINAALKGDLGPIGTVWSHSAEASDFGPLGGRAVGWNAILGEYQRSGRITTGGKVTPKDITVGVAGDLGYSTCVEERGAQTTSGQTVAVTDRATNIFRREDGQWKLVHRHVDSLPELQPASARR
jgi:ketosteroid isomerase-like protein